MITLHHYTQSDQSPTQLINPDDFEAKRWYYDVDEQAQCLIKWDEDAEDGFCFLNFDKQILWQLSTPICHGKLDPIHRIVWLVQRDNNEQVTVLVHDYHGTLKASLVMRDELYQSHFIITPLPEPMSIALDFGGGQDGSQSYFLQFANDKINIIKTLEDDLCLLFTFADDTKAVLLNFYENMFFVVSYPKLTVLAQFTMPEEAYFGNLSKISDRIWLLADEQHYRYFLFDSDSMQLMDEVVVSGHEPTPDTDGEIISNISDMYYQDGKMIFSHYEIIGKFPNIQEKYWWGVADFDATPYS